MSNMFSEASDYSRYMQYDEPDEQDERERPYEPDPDDQYDAMIDRHMDWLRDKNSDPDHYCPQCREEARRRAEKGKK